MLPIKFHYDNGILSLFAYEQRSYVMQGMESLPLQEGDSEESQNTLKELQEYSEDVETPFDKLEDFLYRKLGEFNMNEPFASEDIYINGFKVNIVFAAENPDSYVIIGIDYSGKDRAPAVHFDFELAQKITFLVVASGERHSIDDPILDTVIGTTKTSITFEL